MNIKKPSVSVIIPTYNRKDLVLETINSVLKQTFKDYEIIVVDDGSTDGTQLELSYLVHSGKLRYVYQENNGLASARNRGIDESVGRYLAFLDSDDIWLPSKLEKQVAMLEKDPHCAMVYTDSRNFNEYGLSPVSRLVSSDKNTMAGMIWEYLVMGNFINPSTVLIRKTVIGQVGYFDTALKMGEDWDFWMRIAHKNRIGFIDEALVHYRIHSNNMTKNTAVLTQYLTLIINKTFMKSLMDKKNVKKKKLALGLVHQRAGWDYLSSGEAKKARHEFLTLIRISPLNLMGYKLFIKSLLPKCVLSIKSNSARGQYVQ